MNKNFKKYYLSTFVLFLATFLFMVLIGRSSIFVIESLGICISMALILSLIVGSLTYYLNEIWLPKTRKSILTESPFKELLANGFTEQDGYVSQIIEGYTIVVSFERETYKFIMVRAFFDPEVNKRPYTKAEIDNIFKPYDTHTWYQNKLLWWANGLVYYQIPFAFNPPKYSAVQQRIDDLVNILRSENLKPFSYNSQGNYQKSKAGNK